jgi:hypothetical protein
MYEAHQERGGLATRLFLEHAHAVTGEGLLHLLIEVAGVEGLDEKAIGAGFKTGGHLFGASVGADYEDWDFLRARAAAQAADQVGRIHIGQRGVQQDEVKGERIGLAQTFILASGDDYVAPARPLENSADGLQGGGIVIDDQDMTEAVRIGCD